MTVFYLVIDIKDLGKDWELHVQTGTNGMSELVVGATLFTYLVDAYILSWYALLKDYAYIECFVPWVGQPGVIVAIWSNSLVLLLLHNCYLYAILPS